MYLRPAPLLQLRHNLPISMKKFLLFVCLAVAVCSAQLWCASPSGNSPSDAGEYCKSVDPNCGVGIAHDALMPKVMPMKVKHNADMRKQRKEHEQCVQEGKCPTLLAPEGYTPCENGFAGEYPCNNVDLLAYVSLPELGTEGDGNDIWGWTDPETSKEYAIVCTTHGTSFVDISTPTEPLVLAWLPTETYSTIWRDAKVYKNHAYIVSEALGHGMQVFDLTRLRGMTPTTPVTVVQADSVYEEIGSSHNMVINEDSGYGYIVGSRTCSGGLHMVDIRDPKVPKFAGCFCADGYTHDAQCVIYDGPDGRYKGKEICFAYNEDSLTIVDVTEKKFPIQISRKGYAYSQYTHQGWLTKDMSALLLNDELDETNEAGEWKFPNTRSLAWDVSNLEDPKLVESFWSSKQAIDHNLYIKDNYSYMSNYCSGLRIVDISDFYNMTEVAYFDVDPDCDEAVFSGAWSSYIYFPSGTIVTNSIERGLFILQVTLPSTDKPKKPFLHNPTVHLMD